MRNAYKIKIRGLHNLLASSKYILFAGLYLAQSFTTGINRSRRANFNLSIHN